MRKKRWQIGFCLFSCLLLLFPGKWYAAEAEAEKESSNLSEIQKEIRFGKVGKYGMTPILASDVKDGTYEIEVDSSSPYFKITHAELIVDGDEMTAAFTIGSLSYSYVYPGTAKQARKLGETDWIKAETKSGTSIFTIPVEALNQTMDCAAYSKRRKLWYDRKILFDATTLPEGALEIELPDYDLIEAAILAYDDGSLNDAAQVAEEDTPVREPEPVRVGLDDGEYSIEVNMTGGSGRASVSSPTNLIVRDGKAYARLLWSSMYYDYMILEDKTYYNLATEGGNSTFEIPITVMDEPMTVIADTTAMGDPVEIQYTLTFYEETIGTKGQIPQVAAKKVLIIALIIIGAGGILNYFVKKKRK